MSTNYLIDAANIHIYIVYNNKNSFFFFLNFYFLSILAIFVALFTIYILFI